MNGREIAPYGYVARLMRMVMAVLRIENVGFKPILKDETLRVSCPPLERVRYCSLSMPK